jgi:hypothetical protein
MASSLMKWLEKSKGRKSIRGSTLILITILFISGCSLSDRMRALNEPTAKPTSPITQEPTPTAANGPTPLPTQISIPQGLVRIPVPGAARRTASDLNSAERPAMDRNRLAQELRGVTSEQLIPNLPDEIPYEINHRLEFIVDKNLAGDNRALPATLRHISENAYWWTSVIVRVDEDEIVTAAQTFEEEILRINRETFGTEWSPGIDNDPRIHILLVNEPQWDNTIGYFSSIHEYPSSVEPSSNKKEMIFVNLEPLAIDSSAFSGELAQAYQHLIHWNQDPNEDFWLKEAMSQLAVSLSGATFVSNGLRFTNAELFANDPSIQLTSRPDDRAVSGEEKIYAHYAAERLFAIYLFEQFGSQFIRDVVQNPAPGVLGIQEELAKLPGSPIFEDVYASWIVANLINRTSLEDGQYGYQQIRPERPLLEPVESISGNPVADQLPPYGARYYELRQDDPVEVNFVGSTLARLTPADPPSGNFAWYSNRGDESEFTLTREFDLNELDAATLKFRTWYQLEKYYDYAYLEISTDGGQTWEILNTIHGTNENPNFLAYGMGYTGSSLEWHFESIDLSSYTGQKVLIRFHVITDFTTNQDGFQVDDISIPELEYFDGAEDDSGGWEANGFIRSNNIVPVEWILWLVKTSNPIQVERIGITPEQSADFEISGLGEEFNIAYIVVSPTAPVTTMALNYELRFEQP